MRTLRIAAHTEAASLTALLLNLLTVHLAAVSSLVGPLHGLAYLVALVSTWRTTTAASRGARWRAVIPGVGGLVALRHIRSRTRTRAVAALGPVGASGDPSRS
ncbi:hypothetical protein [Streptomyces sp. SP18CS02]|uniref:hypothetical protein n=1 Tax=Streptomyces sp. SP18CS02 TaxID=3002531 RepID=UPI002E795B23|nr:hypothetical protein [Streptomyces sp. SP18CS02]MEE1751569.1 hypothetical protein [Streptomyces sp. SP18CS02]